MPILFERDANYTGAGVIESGQGKIIMRSESPDGADTIVRVEDLPLPLSIPITTNVEVLGSAICVINTLSTPQAAYTNFRTGDGTGVSTGNLTISEGGSTVLYGGSGKALFRYIQDGTILQEARIDLGRLNYPFNAVLPSGLPGTTELQIIIPDAGFLLTS